jgi:hypothetical protein
MTEEVIIEGGYKGNVNLKRRSVEIQWTPELVQEYVKCAKDPVYFIEKYMKIISINEGLINFNLYDYQKEMITSMAENRYTVIATARQAGKSTTTCGFILWYIIFNPDKTVALLANKGDTAREILGRIQLAYQHLPKWLQQGIIEWNKGSFVLENNSRVIAAATSSDAIRGYSINLLFIDEAAFIDTWDEFFTSVYPTISSGNDSKIVLVSTPNGLNHFHKIWVEAEQQKNQYKPIKVMWYDVPGRDDKWREDTIAAMSFDTEKFEQEYCVEFLGSSGTLIAGWKLKELVSKIPLFDKNGIKQYVEPQKDHAYVIVVDVSRGKGLDYSAFQVIDVSKMPYEQVCTFRDNMITPTDYCSIIHRISRSYNNASVLVEINDIGGQVSDMLYYEYDMDTLLSSENDGRAGKRISSGFSGSSADKGIRTTKTVKSVGCSMMKLLIEQNQLIINDHETIHELSVFSRKGKSYEAESGNHDDLVMCLVLFAWLSDQHYFREMTDINTLTKIRDKDDEQIASELTPFGFFSEGTDEPDLELPKAENWMWAEDKNEKWH